MSFYRKKIVIAVTGASGVVYAQSLLYKLSMLSEQVDKVGVVLSENAHDVWRYELKTELNEKVYAYDFYKNNNFYAPFASGSAVYDVMVVCPCTMGTLAKIANGVADNLIARAADVTLKEQKKLIIVPRETPFNLIHIENMKKISQAGGIIAPANPSFYSLPETISDLVSNFTDHILTLSGLQISQYRWQEK